MNHFISINGTDYKIIGENTLYLEDWLKADGMALKDEFVCDMAADGHSEDQIQEAWNSLVDTFHEFCEENDLEGEEV